MRRKIYKTIVLGLTALSPFMTKANNAEYTGSAEHNPNTIEHVTDSQQEFNDGKTISYEDAERIEPDNEGKEEMVSRFEFFFDTGFEMGKADVSQEVYQNLVQECSDFLKNLPQEVVEKLTNNEARIIVHGGASYHNIDPEVGVDTGSRGRVYDNESLAELRATVGKDIISNEVLKNNPDFSSVTIETEAHVYDKGDSETTLEEGRLLRITIEEDIASIPSMKTVQELHNKFPDAKIAFLINDGSESNKGHAGELFDAAQHFGLIDGPIDFYVGTNQRDLTEKRSISSSEAAEYVTMKEREDSDNRFSNKEEMVNAGARILQEQAIVPEEERGNKPHIGVVVTDEALHMTLNQINALQESESYRNTKLVFVIADREDRATTQVTLDDLKSILINELGAEKDPTQRFSIDVNKQIIGGGIADYVIENKLTDGTEYASR
jgi:hypothetical protein